MKGCFLHCCLLFLCSCMGMGCANIVPPSGGEKDITPPRLVSVTPADSQLEVRTTKFTLLFDEYITVTEPATQIGISPLLPVPLNVTGLNKHVTITIPDTLLEPNTTYRVTFGNAIRDLHEGNIYNGGGYIFSTGTYFDSLRIDGRIYNSMTGLPDTAAFVLLYDAAANDSAVTRRKPLYATHTDAGGNFAFEGLPARTFRIHALQDANGNLVYDGGREWIAFLEQPLLPRPDSVLSFRLRTFPEAAPDTAAQATGSGKLDLSGRTAPPPAAGGPPYQVQADTSDGRRRTQDITSPLVINFSRQPAAIQPGKVYLTYDSANVTVEAPVTVSYDTPRRQLLVQTPWKEALLYTLRLQKGFAADSAGNDLLPGRYTFRTKRSDDYAELGIHLPAKYYGKGYVLQVVTGEDTVYQRPVTDTLVSLSRLAPGNYGIRVIEDRNGNGRWDTGDLFGRKQPELVIPYGQPLLLKAGWENNIDFEPVSGGKPKIGASGPQ